MLYTNFKVGEKEYKLRLTAKNLVEVEKKLGENPINAIMRIVNDDKIPEISCLLTILWGAMQAFTPNMTMDAVYGIYDEFVDDGNTLTELVPVLMNVFKVSGFIKNDIEKN